MSEQQPMTDNALKPCPCCTGEAASMFVTGMVCEWRVYCRTCGLGLSIGCKPFDKESRERARAEAERRWNTRAIESTRSPLPDDVREVVEGLTHHARVLGYADQTHFDDVRAMCREAKPFIERAAALIQSLQALIEDARERERAATEALTPSGDTKAAYMGEFSFSVEVAHPRLGSEHRSIDVPWTTIKEIMAAIRARARLNGEKADG